MHLRQFKRILLLVPFAALSPVFAAQPTNTAPATPAADPAARRPVPVTRTNAPALPATAVRGTPVVRPGATPDAATSAAPRVVPAPPVPGQPVATESATPSKPATPVAVPTPPANAAAAKKAEDKAKMDEIVPLLNFDNMPLAQVLDFYSEMIGRTILRPSSLPLTTLITVKARGPLTRGEAQMALETVMAMNGITIIPIGEKFVKVVVEGAAAQAGGAFSHADPKELPESGRFVTQIVQIKYILIDDAVKAISAFGKTGSGIIPIPGSQTLVLRDYSENVKRMLEVLEKVDVVSELNVKPEVIPIKYALAGDIAQVLGSLTSSGPGVSVGRSSRGGLSSTGASGYSPGTTTGGQQGMMNQPTTTGGLSSGSALNRSSFQDRLAGIVRRASSAGEIQVLGETKIIADERTNSLLIFANDQDMVMIKTIIAQLDVVLAQVLIEAIIMDITLGDDQTLGVSYIQQPKGLGGATTAGGVNNNTPFFSPNNFNALAGTNATAPTRVGLTNLPSGFSYFANIGKSFDVALEASANDSRVNILSRPRVQTSHAVEAQLFVGQTRPYVTGTYFGGGVSGNSSQYQQKEIGIRINVLPLINPDGLVVMDISQNIESPGENVRIDGNDVPSTLKREALAKVAVRDRETVILGGFISTSKNKSKGGVPYLKDIPYFGALFRSQKEENFRSELMVFLRPTVLPTPEMAAAVATDEKEKLPGLKRSEWEIREEERLRNEQIEAEMRKKLGLKDPKANRR